MLEFLARSLDASTIFTIAALGELIGQRSGILNVGIEGVSKGAEGSRFAGTNFAGDESGKPFLEGESETGLDLAIAARGKEVAGSDRFCERCKLKAVEIIQSGHCFPPHFLQNPWAKGAG